MSFSTNRANGQTYQNCCAAISDAEPSELSSSRRASTSSIPSTSSAKTAASTASSTSRKSKSAKVKTASSSHIWTPPAYLEGLPDPSLNLDPATPVHLVYTDGGSYGIGGHSGKKWFSFDRDRSICQKQDSREAAGIHRAAKLWHENWYNSHVIFHTDSQNVACLRRGKGAKNAPGSKRALGQVHSYMQYIGATYEIRWLSREHPEMDKADALSKQHIGRFRNDLSPRSYPPHSSHRGAGYKGFYQRSRHLD